MSDILKEEDIIKNVQEIAKILDKCCTAYYTGVNKEYVVESIKANCRLLNMLNIVLDGD